MKKILLALGLGVVLVGGMSAVSMSDSTSTRESIESEACRYGQCYGTAKSTGKRCRMCVSNPGDAYCGWHN